MIEVPVSSFGQQFSEAPEPFQDNTITGDHINPFGTAVPFWGQTTQILSNLSQKRDCGPKKVK